MSVSLLVVVVDGRVVLRVMSVVAVVWFGCLAPRDSGRGVGKEALAGDQKLDRTTHYLTC